MKTNVLLDRDGFIDGYSFQKKAEGEIAGAVLGTGKWGFTSGWNKAKTIAAIALVAPIVAGIGLGATASKLTSPSGTETKNMQKQLVNSELQEALVDMRRRKEQAIADEQVPAKREREIRL